MRKNNHINILCISLFLLSCNSSSNFSKLSYAVYKANVIRHNKVSRKTEKFGYKVRTLIERRYPIEFINFHKDTVFIIKLYDYDTGLYLMTIFNSSNSVEAKSHGGDPLDSLVVKPNTFTYSAEFKKDIIKWDTVSIRAKAFKGKRALSYMDVNRIIINNRKFSVQVVRCI